MAPYATGELRVDLKWLWSEHNNHRVLLPRLLYLAFWHLLGPSFRWGMYLGAFALTATAILFVVAAKRLRGHLSYTDAFFPLLLLSRGHAELLLSAFNSTCNILTVLILSLLAVAISISPDPLSGFRLWIPRWASEEPIFVVARCGQVIRPVSGSPIRCK